MNSNKKRSLIGLMEREQIFYSLFERSREAIIISGADGNVIHANLTAAKMLGHRSPEEMIGRLSVNAYVRPGDRDLIFRELELKGFIENHEVELIRQNGTNSRFFALVSAAMVKDNQGNLIRVEAILSDITDRKNLEWSLQDSQKRYYLLFSEMLNGCAVHEAIFDNNGKVIDYITLEVNTAYEKLLNVHGEDIVGIKASSVLPEKELDSWLEIFDQVVTTSKSTRYELYSEIYRKYFEGTAYRTEKNKFIVTFSDITQRKKTEVELLVSQNYLNAVYQNTNIGLAIGDLNGNFVDINPAVESILGYNLKELQQLSIDGITHPDDLAKDFALFQEVIEEKRDRYQLEKRYIHKNGNVVWGLVNVSVIRDKDGKMQFTIATIEDITERKLIEQELLKSKDEVTNLLAHLENIREMERTKIAADLHDDLGQRLTALNMDLSWLKNRLKFARPEIAERLASISSMLLKTIETVQYISTELRPGILDDFGLTATIEWHLEEVRKRTGIHYVFSSLPEEFVFSPDISILFFRIIQEALTNITRHSAATDVSIALKQENRKLRLTISDNGRGITTSEIKNPKSFGIIGMRQRVKTFGGDFTISGKNRRGTTIEIGIPQNWHND